MPPRKTTHSRLAPAPRQTRLASRRSLPLTRRRNSPPVLQKRQSTLTQIDYIRSDGPAQSSSDEAELSEYEDTQPRKKARLSKGKQAKGQNPGQSTLTQKWDWKAMAVARDSEESENDLEMLGHEDTEQEEDVHSEPKRPTSKGHTQTQSELLLVAHVDSESNTEGSTPQPRRVAFAASSDVEKLNTRRTTADATTNPNPKTPRRPRRTEIPSSETPLSLKLSRHSPKQHELYERSPLKERSSNVPSFKRSRSPTSDKKHEADSTPQVLPVEKTGNGSLQASPCKVALAITPKKGSILGKRQLQRTMTIQESDASDMELELSPIQRKLEPVPSPAHPHPVQPRRGRLQRATTIQDSQENSSDLTEPDDVISGEAATVEALAAEPSPIQDVNTATPAAGREDSMSEQLGSNSLETDLSPKRASQSTPPDLEDSQICSAKDPVPDVGPQAIDVQDFVDFHFDRAQTAQAVPAKAEVGRNDDETDDDLNPRGHDSDDEDDDDYMDDETYPQTYDPVSAALERDAARYGRDTQYESDEEYADDEGSVVAATDGEADIGDGIDEVEIVPSSQPGEARIRSSQEADALQYIDTSIDDHTPVGDVDDSGYSSQHPSVKRSKSFLNISWNAGPRPSQISTVVDDTQSPRSRPNSAHGWTQKSAPAWPETLSSSPFPLPPGFALRSQRRAGDTQSSGLIDFSLPPPPPLFLSSSRGEGEEV